MGEGWGEGEHTAVVLVPFTLYSLLFYNRTSGERARVAQSPPPATRAPGGKSSLRDTLGLFLPAIGSGVACIHAGHALSAHPCASPRPSGNASAIYSRTRASLKALSQSEDNVIASAFKLLRNPLPIRGHFPSCAVTICLCKTIEDNKDIAYQ